MENTHKYLIRIFPLLILLIAFINCKKENVAPVPVIIKDATVVNKFIYNGLKDYYLWVDQIPNLVATKYSNKDTLNNFLNGYTDPNTLFTSLFTNTKRSINGRLLWTTQRL